MPYEYQINSADPLIAARDACAWAQFFIKKGTTQLINNTYEENQRSSLTKAIQDLRIAKIGYPAFSLELNDDINNFYQTIEISKKLSLGNCFELALIAMDYILTYEPSLYAEIYQIHGGDHVFLVIAGCPRRGVNQPAGWEYDAYICDPWANRVFPAIDYISELTNFYRISNSSGIAINNIEKFNPALHKLMPVGNFNTSFLRRAESRYHICFLHKTFLERCGLLQKIIRSLEENLCLIADKLKEICGSNQEKRLVLLGLIDNLQEVSSAITSNYKIILAVPGGYQQVKKQLERSLFKNYQNLKRILKIDPADQKILAQPDSLSFSGKMLSFFKTPAYTTKINEALVQSQVELQDFLYLK